MRKIPKNPVQKTIVYMQRKKAAPNAEKNTKLPVEACYFKRKFYIY